MKLFIYSAIIFSLILFGCTEQTSVVEPESAKSLNVSIELVNADKDADLASALVRLSCQGRETIEAPLQINGDQVYGTVDNIPIGEWDVFLEICDSKMEAVYSGSGFCKIQPNKTTQITIHLKSCTGSAEIIGIIDEGDSTIEIPQNPITAPFSLDDHTLALYHFDEKTGSVIIDETELWDGNLQAGTRTEGMFSGAISFEPGESAYFDTIVTDGVASGTIEFFVKFDSSFNPGATYTIVGNDGARLLFVYDNGDFVFMKNHSDIYKFVRAPVSVEKDVWYHIAGTWGQKGMRVLINGKEFNSINDTTVYQSSPRSTAENEFAIGAKSWCCMLGAGIKEDLDFDGALDELRISDIERY